MESGTNPSTLVNTDFLRSGREFSPATSETDSARLIQRPSGLSRHARLERFHNAMLTALAPRTNPVKKPNGPSSVVHVGFLRAGSNRVPSEMKQVDIKKKRTKHARLEEFHNQMLEVHKHKETPTSSPSVMVNTEFLRSGKEFLATASESSSQQEPDFKGRHFRLEEFQKRMLQAYNNNKSAAPASNASIDTPINLDFLRSGREFEVPTATTPESKRYNNFKRETATSKNEKLVDFHNKMLQAYAMAASNTRERNSSNPSSKSSSAKDQSKKSSEEPITVNLEFLRSGSEFHEPTSTSPQVQRYNGFRAKGRYTRLEQFHDRMLQQHAATAN